MSLLSKLFGGGGGGKEPDPVVYQGYRIIPTPMKEGSEYRLAARIEKDEGGETKAHVLIRADTLGSAEAASDAAVAKAKQVIDQQGDGIFG